MYGGFAENRQRPSVFTTAQWRVNRLEQYDLHVHTNWSDGSMPVEEAVEFAARRGLAGLAVSDHDSMEMVGRARRRAASLGLTVIPAAELSCIDPDTRRKVHLLVYAPSRPEVLEPHFRLLAGRRRRVGEEIIGLVCRLYPVKAERIYELARESGTIYRVHILRALMELGYANTIYGPLYGELFGKPDGTCLRQVEYPNVYETAQTARESGGAVVLAHPGVYRSFVVADRLAGMGLIDGIEYRYPRRREEDAALHDELVSRHHLLSTGGTDFHGCYTTNPHPLGSCTTSAEELQRLLERAGGGNHDRKEENT